MLKRSCHAVLPSYFRILLTFRILLPYATTYLCESDFSAFVHHAKRKAQNPRKVEDDMKMALSNTKPRIPKLP